MDVIIIQYLSTADIQAAVESRASRAESELVEATESLATITVERDQLQARVRVGNMTLNSTPRYIIIDLLIR